MATKSSSDSAQPPLSETIALRDLAIEAAIEREDWYPIADLAMHQVYSHHELQCFESARDYAELTLDACHMTELRTSAIRKLELDALDMSALEHFYLGEFGQAASHIASAAELARLDPFHPRVLARIEWTAALIDRWRGDAFAALHHALNSLEIFSPLDSPLNVARLRIVIADIALDIAASFTPQYGDTHTEFIELAAANLAKSMKSGTMQEDVAGRALADIAYIRLSRLVNANEDRLALLEHIGAVAQRLGDLPLLGQVETSVGDELAYQGYMGAACKQYDHAVKLLKQSDARVLAIWPQRSLLRHKERSLQD